MHNPFLITKIRGVCTKLNLRLDTNNSPTYINIYTFIFSFTFEVQPRGITFSTFTLRCCVWKTRSEGGTHRRCIKSIKNCLEDQAYPFGITRDIEEVTEKVQC
jgi:hypothetical protein